MFISSILFALFGYTVDERLTISVGNATYFKEYQRYISQTCTICEDMTISSGKISLSDDLIANLANLKTLNMTNLEIFSISPNFLRNLPKLEDLIIEETNLNKLPSNLMQNVPSLQRFSLARNRIDEIEPKAFDNMTKLAYVNLGCNFLTDIDQNWFKNCSSLRTINFRENRIESVDTGDFRYIKTTQAKPITLILSYNRIYALESGCFSPLEYIDILMLDNNNLQFIPESAFKSVRFMRKVDITNNRLKSYSFDFGSLKSLLMSGNEENCKYVSSHLFSNQTLECNEFY